jgi:hypothetical protein
MFRGLLLGLLSVLVVTAMVTTPVFAGETHTCKADSDCGHGEHCKDGHCHK